MSIELGEANADRFLAAITPGLGDPTFSILKAHLLFEEVPRTYAERSVHNPQALVGARLSFAQVLALVRAFHPPMLDDWQWEAITKLNSLRNQFTHHLAPGERDAKIDAYVAFVTSGFGLHLPPAEGAPWLRLRQPAARSTKQLTWPTPRFSGPSKLAFALDMPSDQRPNPSIERTSSGKLRLPPAAGHVGR